MSLLYTSSIEDKKVSKALIIMDLLAFGAIIGGLFLPNPLSNISLSIGCSIMASSVFYLLFAKKTEIKQLSQIAEKTAEYIVETYEKHLPVFYDGTSDRPNNEFGKKFDQLLSDSTSYRHHGDTASFASFRLCTQKEKFQTGTKVRILLINPKCKEILTSKARYDIESMKKYQQKYCIDQKIIDQEVNCRVAELKMRIATTLFGIYKYHNNTNNYPNGDTLDITLSFHKDFLFYQSDILCKGLILTYYATGKPSNIYLFKRDSYGYDAFIKDFDARWDKYSKLQISFKFKSYKDFQRVVKKKIGLQMPDHATMVKQWAEREAKYKNTLKN